MHPHFTTDSPIVTVTPGIYIISGVVTVNVDSGQLRIKAGAFENRPELRLSKATSRLKRLILLGHSGTISLKAFRWLHDIGAAVLQIDYDASVVLASAPSGLDYPLLRRKQAQAAGSDLGLKIARTLLLWKVEKQADVCLNLRKDAEAHQILDLLPDFSSASSPPDLMAIESQAAVIYWKSWSETKIGFAREHRRRVPDHWKSFTGRLSPLTNSPRKASNPANALLNYLYALLEAESRIAAIAMGLDPGLGVLHADQRARDSLIYDLMEPSRPQVDLWLHRFISKRSFSKSDFFETPEGQIMICAPLARELSTTVPLWTKAAAPVAEWMAKSLLGSNVPTKLTRASRSRKDRSFANTNVLRAARGADRPASSCPQCGKQVPSGRRTCSIECAKTYRDEVLIPAFSLAGLGALAEMRASGHDPAHGGDVARRRGETNRNWGKKRASWKGDLNREKERFVSEILPRMRDIPISKIVEATGLSTRYVSLILRGECVPHPVHYPLLEGLIRGGDENGADS